MKNEKELHERITKFLSDRVESDSDLAPVSTKDEYELYAIFDALIELKFERDCDSYLPITYVPTNRHTHTQTLFSSIARTREGESPLREMRSYASLAGWANGVVQNKINIMQTEKDEKNKSTK